MPAWGKSSALFCKSRDFDRIQWRRHTSPTRYINELSGVFLSTTTQRVLPQALALTVYCSFLELYDQLLVAPSTSSMPSVQLLPYEFFDFTAPLLGLLLVFRTDRAYERYKEGVEASWALSWKLKDVLRSVLVCTEDQKDRRFDEVEELCQLIIDFHNWILMVYLSPDEVDSRGLTAKLNGLVGRKPGAILQPGHVQLVISTEINELPRLSEQQRQGIDAILWDVTMQVRQCESLLRNPIPLGYTWLAYHFLFIWLGLLPLGLLTKFQEFANSKVMDMPLRIGLPFMFFLVAMVFLSIEDVAMQIEEPFASRTRQNAKLSQWFAEEAAEMTESDTSCSTVRTSP